MNLFAIEQLTLPLLECQPASHRPGEGWDLGGQSRRKRFAPDRPGGNATIVAPLTAPAHAEIQASESSLALQRPQQLGRSERMWEHLPQIALTEQRSMHVLLEVWG